MRLLSFLCPNRSCNTLRLAQGACQRLAQVPLRLAQVAHAMTSLANLVAARVELLDLNLRSGMCADGPRFLRLAETSVDSILAQIRNLALIPSATIVLAMRQFVGTNLLNEEHQNRIRDAMNEKVNHNAPTHNAANCKYQSVREPHKWLPDGLHNMVWLPAGGGQQVSRFQSMKN